MTSHNYVLDVIIQCHIKTFDWIMALFLVKNMVKKMLVQRQTLNLLRAFTWNLIHVFGQIIVGHWRGAITLLCIWPNYGPLWNCWWNFCMQLFVSLKVFACNFSQLWYHNWRSLFKTHISSLNFDRIVSLCEWIQFCLQHFIL